MTIIKDNSRLKKLSKVFGFQYDAKHGYIVDSGNLENSIAAKRKLQSNGYDLKYFDGCFYPFIIEK